MRFIVVTALALCFVTPSVAQLTETKGNPGSLLQPGAHNPFVDRIARRAGDILTIIISESSAATFAANTTATKNDSNSVSSQLFNGLVDRILGPSASTSASSSIAGDGSTKHSGSMSTRMSATIKEVLPNGNMVIEGLRTLVTNKQTQIFKLSGIIRQDDITPDNTIKSENIAGAEIHMDGKGMIAERQRKGILNQLLDWLF